MKEGERHEQDVPLSDAGTDVTVALPESGRAAGAQVYVLDGTVDARDGAGLTAVLSAMSAAIQIAHLYKGGSAVFSKRTNRRTFRLCAAVGRPQWHCGQS